MKAQNQRNSRIAGLKQSELAKLIQQYGCGPVRFSGTDEALYERHLVFDNVMEMSAIGARERRGDVRLGASGSVAAASARRRPARCGRGSV